MQPINFGKLYSEFTASKLASKKTADINNFMKLLVSFSNEMRNCSLSNIEKLIKSKLRTKQRDLSCNVPVELQEKVWSAVFNLERSLLVQFTNDMWKHHIGFNWYVISMD